jgi:hypothetical protein
MAAGSSYNTPMFKGSVKVNKMALVVLVVLAIVGAYVLINTLVGNVSWSGLPAGSSWYNGYR